MDWYFLQFAATEAEQPGGIAALGLNVKAFLFQLITFVLVLLLLRRFVFPKLVATLEQRRATLEASLDQAKKTEEALASAQNEAESLIAKARQQSDTALAEAKKAAQLVIADAEVAGSTKAARIIADAQADLTRQQQQLRDELKGELTELVAQATETVIRKKLDRKADEALIAASLKELEL